MLAAATIADLNDTFLDTNESLSGICHYFFSKTRAAGNLPSDAYRALAAQLFQQFQHAEKIRSGLSLLLGELATRTPATEHELLDFFRHCLPDLSHPVFIIDAVDECSEPEKLVRSLAALSESSSLKLVFFSRPEIGRASCRERV